MILKSLSRKSGTKQLLQYLFKKEEKLVFEKEQPLIIRHNVRSKTLAKWIREFENNETFRRNRRKNNVKAYHTILSFSSKDRECITKKMLKDIARQYMKLRGNDNLYIGTAHFDRDHIHLHLVMSGSTFLTGRSNRLSKAQFQELKKTMDAYQIKKYPELSHSIPRHGLSKGLIAKDKASKLEKVMSGRQNQKETILAALNKAFESSKSEVEFLSQLQALGHEPYYRAGRLTGVKFEGDRKFRFSRLGYDTDKIAEIGSGRGTRLEKLSELRSLREGLSRSRFSPKGSRDNKGIDRSGRDSDEDDNLNTESDEQELDDGIR